MVEVDDPRDAFTEWARCHVDSSTVEVHTVPYAVVLGVGQAKWIAGEAFAEPLLASSIYMSLWTSNGVAPAQLLAAHPPASTGDPGTTAAVAAFVDRAAGDLEADNHLFTWAHVGEPVELGAFIRGLEPLLTSLIDHTAVLYVRTPDRGPLAVALVFLDPLALEDELDEPLEDEEPPDQAALDAAGTLCIKTLTMKAGLTRG